MKKIMFFIFIFPFCLHAMAPKDLSKIINLAGKQRMLSQRIAKDALFVVRSVNKDESVKDIKKAMNNFSLVLEGLRNGNKLLGIVKVNDSKIQKQLTVVDGLWKIFKNQINLVLRGNHDRGILKKIAKDSEPLLNEMNKAVEMYAGRHKQITKGHLSYEKAVAINLAGKQRMLSQKMTKELLQVSLSLSKTESLKLLEQSRSLFDKTLTGLISSDETLGLVSSANLEIQNQLSIVREIWNKYKIIIDQSIDAKHVDVDVLENVYRLNINILDEMNRAVTLIEQKY